MTNWREDIDRAYREHPPEYHEERLSNFAAIAWRWLFVILWILAIGASLDCAGVIR